MRETRMPQHVIETRLILVYCRCWQHPLSVHCCIHAVAEQTFDAYFWGLSRLIRPTMQDSEDVALTEFLSKAHLCCAYKVAQK